MNDGKNLSLLPCPFCGGSAMIKYDDEWYYGAWYVSCCRCGARSGVECEEIDDESNDQARGRCADSWNARHSPNADLS
jgi:hypothetical protein